MHLGLILVAKLNVSRQIFHIKNKKDPAWNKKCFKDEKHENVSLRDPGSSTSLKIIKAIKSLYNTFS